MKTNVSKSDFRLAFETSESRSKQFSYEAQGILFDWLEQLGDETGEETELDIVGICCEFAEADYDQIASDYTIYGYDPDADDEERADIVREYLSKKTQVCGEVDGGFVYQQF